MGNLKYRLAQAYLYAGLIATGWLFERKPEIADCACGQDHDKMPTVYDPEFGVTFELICREHKRHVPCRRCERIAAIDEMED